MIFHQARDVNWDPVPCGTQWTWTQWTQSRGALERCTSKMDGCRLESFQIHFFTSNSVAAGIVVYQTYWILYLTGECYISLFPTAVFVGFESLGLGQLPHGCHARKTEGEP